MRKAASLLLGVTLAATLLVGWRTLSFAQPPGAEPREGKEGEVPRKVEEEAKRLGVKPEDLWREQRKFDMEMERERMKQPPVVLVSGNSLYVLRGPWLYQFDPEGLKLKSMQNLDFLTGQFFRKMKEEKEQRQKEEKQEKQ